MSVLGKKVRLKGRSQKGKNRVRDHGEMWTVLAEADRVLFAPSNPGPWLFVAAEGCDQNHKSSRWVKTAGDADFEVVIQD